MNLKQPVQLCLPILSLEISFKFISPGEPPIFNLEPPTILPDQLPSQIDVTGQSLIIYFYSSTTF